MKKVTLEKMTVLVELIGFAMVVALIWIDEILDLPHRLLGAEKHR